MLDLEAGRAYAVRVEFYENRGRASCRLDWRLAPSGREIIPTAALRPSKHRIPVASVASPAFVEGLTFPDEILRVTVGGLEVEPIRLGTTGFWLDVPLEPGTPVAVEIEPPSEVVAREITWQALPLDGGPEAVIRAGDALLISAPAGGAVSILTESGVASGATPVPPAGQLSCDFPNVGYFTVVAEGPDGIPAGSREVVVLGTGLAAKPIAAEVGYPRGVTVTAEPAASYFAWNAAAGSDLELSSAPGVEADEASLTLKPRSRGEPVVVARVGSADGPIIATREVDEFTVNTAALRHVSALENTGQAATAVVMKPYVPNVFWEFRMFASKSTFAGGLRRFEVNTSDGSWTTEVDPETGEVVGRFRLELEIPKGETKYCFEWYASQRNSPKVQITTKKRTNGEACKIEVGGGIFVVPECDDERPGNINVETCLQEVETWEYKAKQFGVAEEGTMGAYQLGVTPEPCGPGPEGVFAAPFGGSECPPSNAPRGTCISKLEMRFSDGCDVVWPKVCKLCNDECFNLGLHTGTKPSSSTFTLTDCESGESVEKEDFFQIYHLDLNGYTGPDDMSGKDVFPDAARNWPKQDEFWSSDATCTVKGVPVQVLLEGPKKRKVRVVSRSDRIWLSTDAEIRVAHGDQPGDHLVRCTEVDLGNLTQCLYGGVVYMYGVEDSLGTVDSEFIEAHMLELHSYCSGGSVEFDETTWGLGDVERTLVRPIDVDIFRLDGSRVSDQDEFGPGSICTIEQPQVGERDTWLDLVFGIPRVGAFSCYRYFVRTVGPSASVAGLVELHHGENLVYTSGDEEVEISYDDLISGGWRVKGVETGTVDLVLECRQAEDRSTRLGCDRIRVSVAPCAPLRNGDILLVNSGDELDVEDCGYEAYDLVADALEESSDNNNIAVARGSYPERGLQMKAKCTLVGLGGRWSSLEGWGRFDWDSALPILAGEETRSGILKAYSKDDIAVLGIEFDKGKDQLYGGGLEINGCEETIVACSKFTKCEVTNPILEARGAGLAVLDSSKVTIKHTQFKGNVVFEVTSGAGAIFIKNSSCDVTDNYFEANKGQVYGGCVGIRGDGAGEDDLVIVSRNTMVGNNAQFGACVAVVGRYDDDIAALAAIARLPAGPITGIFGGHRAIITENTMLTNGSLNRNDGETRGGAIYIGGQESQALIEENTIRKNTIGGDGGGVATFNQARSDGRLNTIEENGGPSGDDGGAMTFGTQGKGYWQRNTIRNNKSDENGGGIHASVGAEIVFERNDVTGNVCGNDRDGIGGGVYIRNATFWSLGGNLFEGNSCLNGGGGGLALHAKDNSGNTQLTRLANASPGFMRLHVNDVIKGNHSSGPGGGVLTRTEGTFLVWPRLLMEGVEVSANSSEVSLGGVETSGVAYVGPVNRAEIFNCRITDHPGAGVSIFTRRYTSQTHSIEIQGTDLMDNAVGIVADGAFEIERSVFDRQSQAHMIVSDFVGPPKTTTVEGSFFFGSSGTPVGISVEREGPLNLRIRSSRFEGWTSGGVAIDSANAGRRVDARENWWGHRDGPHDPADGVDDDGDHNVNPSGARVSDWVRYDNWEVL